MILPLGAGAAAAWCWSDCEEILHIQGQRSPSKTVGAGVAVAWWWSNFGDISHVQGQRSSPKKMVGVAKSCLEPNAIPSRNAQRAINKRLTQTYPWVSRSLWQRSGLAVACCRVEGTECSSACMGPSEECQHYLHYLHHSLASGQKRGRKHSPTLQ